MSTGASDGADPCRPARDPCLRGRRATSPVTIAFSETAPERLRDANAIFATSHQLAAGLGVTVASVALRGGAALTDAPRSAYAVAFVALGAL
ncbi:hypothetical protein [Streptomyces sp. NPDC002769]|uniref:hypothetical protein n=1 Tax=Streptomyces sp. NPDC002769 TaxID=3154542 RepID=UPI00331939F9